MNRKDEHFAWALKMFENRENDFDLVRFVHQSVPESDINQINISTQFLGENYSRPFYINAMTGGSKKTATFNRRLAEVAARTGLLMATGSVSAGLNDQELVPTFSVVRETNPSGKIFANVGANRNLEDAKRAIEMFHADGLQIHVNAPQEIAMPEGDREFARWADNIHEIVTNLNVPVIVKEVGFGMSYETIQKLMELGVRAVDVGGTGGTNFIAIENARAKHLHKADFSYAEDWGQSAVISLIESEPFQDKMDVLASGGVRNALDIVKALSLGAKSVGMAGLIQHEMQTVDVEGTIEFIHNLERDIRYIMAMLGARTIEDLQKKPLVLQGNVRDWAIDRGFSPVNYARRGLK
jgi:isopentenyl-diphosphate delta-isomerase